MRKAGVISIDIDAGTTKAIIDLDKVSGKLREIGSAGHGSVSGVQATSGALRVLEGNMTNNLRASERFIANVLHLGPALQAAFPVVGALAFGGILGELGKKVYTFFDGMEKAPAKIADAFRELNNPLRVANDELLVTRDRLAIDIAKLEGKHPNMLALALDQARMASDKLAESLENDIKKLDELMKKNSIGIMDRILGGKATTGSDEDESKLFSERIRNILDRGTAKQAAAKTQQDAQFEREATSVAVLAAIDSQISRQKELIAQAEKLQAIRKQQITDSQQNIGVRGAHRTGIDVPDQSGVLAERGGYLQNLEQVRDKYATAGDIASLEQKKAGLEAGAEAARKYREELKHLTEELERARAAELTGLQRVGVEERNELVRLQTAGQLNKATLAIVTQIYDAKRITVYNEIMTKLNNELGEAARRWQTLSIEAAKASDSFLGKEIEAGTKTLDEHAKAVTKLAEEYQKLTQQAGSQDLQHKVTMVTAGGDHGNPLAALAQQQEMQRQDIENRYHNSLKQANEELQGADLLLAKANLLKERGIELTKLQNQMEEKAADVRQKGIADFFKDMQGQAQSAGNIFYESMHSGLDRISDQFAKLFTGQKTSFGKMFQSLGEEMVRSSVKSAFQQGLGKLGSAFSHNAPTGKNDGSTEESALWVRLAGIGGGLSSLGPQRPGIGLPGATAIGGAVAGVASGIGGFFKSLFAGAGGTPSVSSTFTPMAEGGDVYPGRAYMVGENGPEPFFPRSSGTIVPNHRMGGDTHVYRIDARGAALGSEGRIAAAITQAHNSAVAASVRSGVERQKRVPKSA